jgi:hypothetical protein
MRSFDRTKEGLEKTMTNKKLLLATLAIVLAFGMTVSGCSKGSKSSGGGSNSSKTGDGGTFTLTGIPSEYNGMYAFLEGGTGSVDGYYYGFQSNDTSTNTITLPRISNGKVSIPMWHRLLGYKRFSDDKTFEIRVNITDSSEIPPSGYSKITYVGFKSVKFSKGSATKAWKDAEL